MIIQVADLYPRDDSQPKLTLALDRELPEIDADAVRIRQVMHNLIRNAMEAMDGKAGAEVRVATRQVVSEKGDMVEVRVSDEGPGFQTEALDEVFEPYVTTKPKGTGLGLAIVGYILKLHDSELIIESKVGEGSLFGFSLKKMIKTT